MTPEEVLGEWEGRFTGTNSGRVYLRLTSVPTGMVAEANLDDDSSGPAFLLGTAIVSEGKIEASMTPREAAEIPRFGVVTVRGAMDEEGGLIGDWNTTAGTNGQFTARRPPQPAAVSPAQPAVVRAGVFEKQRRMPACVVNLDVLRRVQAILQAGAVQAAEMHALKQHPVNEGGREELHRRYRVNVLVKGAEGETTATDDPAALTMESLPQPLRSVEFEIGVNYRLATNTFANNRAIVGFDFSKPPAFDISNPSGEPTPNTSSIAAFGEDPFWVAGIFERVSAAIANTAIRTSWLHRPHTYDVLVIFVGLPLAFAVGVLAASHAAAPAGMDEGVFRGSVAVFCGILSLLVFRLGFSVTRWLLPYVEFAPSPEPLHRRLRLFIAGAMLTIALGALGSAAYALFQ